eukprot:NODE_1011_length_2694_cov_0.510212.p4 type:complete len:107 gc:universal NODE_1011_length_2694_cov_0.510212:1901-1581(-)
MFDIPTSAYDVVLFIARYNPITVASKLLYQSLPPGALKDASYNTLLFSYNSILEHPKIILMGCVYGFGIILTWKGIKLVRYCMKWILLASLVYGYFTYLFNKYKQV